MPLLGHEACIEQDAEVLRDGRPAHLEMSRKRARGAGGLDEEVEMKAAGTTVARIHPEMPHNGDSWRIQVI